MAKLYFYYSAMNAGKTTTLLQSAHNYRERGMRVLIFTPKLDFRAGSGTVASRIGLSAEGQALYQALQAARQTLSAQVLAGCDDATQAQLLALLARVRGNLDALPPLETGEDCGHGKGRPSR